MHWYLGHWLVRVKIRTSNLRDLSYVRRPSSISLQTGLARAFLTSSELENIILPQLLTRESSDPGEFLAFEKFEGCSTTS